jgi:sodium-dependent dicarboxylate transporter 2/3/5
LPFVAIFLPIVWLVLWRVARRDPIDSTHGRQVLDRELGALGSLSLGERKVAVVFAAAAALWVFGDPLRTALAPVAQGALGVTLGGKEYEMVVSLSAAAALIAMRAVSFSSLKRLPYSTLVLLGGSFAMAQGMEGSGLAGWIGAQMGRFATMTLSAQVLLASSGTVLLSAVASNTATINIVLNVLPVSTPVLFSTAVSASCDFMLPAGTPPNAIVFGSGYIRLSTMMRIGFVLDIAAALVVTAYVLLYAQHWF